MSTQDNGNVLSLTASDIQSQQYLNAWDAMSKASLKAQGALNSQQSSATTATTTRRQTTDDTDYNDSSEPPAGFLLSTCTPHHCKNTHRERQTHTVDHSSAIHFILFHEDHCSKNANTRLSSNHSRLTKDCLANRFPPSHAADATCSNVGYRLPVS